MLLILSVCLCMVLSVRAEDGTISDLFLSDQDLETDYRSQHFAEVKQTLLAAWQGDLARDKAWDHLGRKLEKRLREASKEVDRQALRGNQLAQEKGRLQQLFDAKVNTMLRFNINLQ